MEHTKSMMPKTGKVFFAVLNCHFKAFKFTRHAKLVSSSNISPHSHTNADEIQKGLASNKGNQTLFHNDVKRKNFFSRFALHHSLGFTLAEVLITLGIIGVVASLTIPSIKNKADEIQFRTGLKKSYTIIDQAYQQILNENGGSFQSRCELNNSTCIINMFKPYIKYNLEVSGTPNSGNLGNCWNNNELHNQDEQHVCAILNDGMSFDFDMETSTCDNGTIKCGYISIDVNGLKKPNIWGKDKFALTLYANRLTAINEGCTDGKGLWTYNRGCAYTYLFEGK